MTEYTNYRLEEIAEFLHSTYLKCLSDEIDPNAEDPEDLDLQSRYGQVVLRVCEEFIAHLKATSPTSPILSLTEVKPEQMAKFLHVTYRRLETDYDVIESSKRDPNFDPKSGYGQVLMRTCEELVARFG